MKKFILILLLFPLLAPAQKLKSVVDLYEQAKYQEALQSAEILRKKTRGSLLAPLDLIIASCLCLTSDDTDKGSRALDQMINNYRLPPTTLKTLQDLRRNCDKPIDENSISFEMLADGRMHQGAGPLMTVGERSVGGSGKDFTRLPTFEANIVPLPELDEITDGPQGVNEVFTLEQKAEAKAYWDNLYQTISHFRQASSQHFTVYSSGSSHTEADLAKLSQRLDRLIAAYSQKYQLEIPPHLISVHLGDRVEDVKAQSMAIYGFSNNTGNIGYSSVNNFTILTYVNGSPLVYPGTIYHELMHILLNYNAPFLPPWLSEGLPALYEASSNNGLTGIHNWRGEEILKFCEPDELPNSLFSMGWDEFDGISTVNEVQMLNRSQKSRNHATARYFVFYLQEINLLEETTTAFVNYHYGDPSFDEFANGTELLEGITGKSQNELWNDYLNWLDEEGYIQTKREIPPPRSNEVFIKGKG